MVFFIVYFGRQANERDCLRPHFSLWLAYHIFTAVSRALNGFQYAKVAALGVSFHTLIYYLSSSHRCPNPNSNARFLRKRIKERSVK